jgi:putative FmdB family regulatory protein
MPIYEYACEFCGKHTETIQKVDEAHLVDCPECGKPGLHRMLSASAFQLKGQGWYVTDFRDKKNNSSETKTDSIPTETKKDKPASKED